MPENEVRKKTKAALQRSGMWACLDGDREARAFLEDAASLDAEGLAHATARFAFECIENTFFSQTWWDGLGRAGQRWARNRANSGIADNPGASRLVDDDVRIVDWNQAVMTCRLP